MKRNIELELDPQIVTELEYMVDLHKRHGAPRRCDRVSKLISWVLACVAEGSRRPGSWERQALLSMGIIAACWQHEEYRQTYGRPDDAPEVEDLNDSQHCKECGRCGDGRPSRSMDDDWTGCTDQGCTECGGCCGTKVSPGLTFLTTKFCFSSDLSHFSVLLPTWKSSFCKIIRERSFPRSKMSLIVFTL